MNDSSREDLGPVERVSLSDLFTYLPDAATDGATFDVEAGLADLFQRIDSAESRPEAKEELSQLLPTRHDTASEDLPAERSPFHHMHATLMSRQLDADVILGQLELEKLHANQAYELKRMRLIQKYEIQKAKADRQHELEELRFSEESRLRNLEVERSKRSRSLRATGRALVVLGVVASYAAAAIYNISSAYFPLSFVVVGYVAGVLLSIQTALRVEDPDRRESAHRVLNLLLGADLRSRFGGMSPDEPAGRRRRQSKARTS